VLPDNAGAPGKTAGAPEQAGHRFLSYFPAYSPGSMTAPGSRLQPVYAHGYVTRIGDDSGGFQDHAGKLHMTFTGMNYIFLWFSIRPDTAIAPRMASSNANQFDASHADAEIVA
jgi:hypothetical protein